MHRLKVLEEVKVLEETTPHRILAPRPPLRVRVGAVGEPVHERRTSDVTREEEEERGPEERESVEWIPSTFFVSQRLRCEHDVFQTGPTVDYGRCV